ncbi:hypothetical protein Celaphus_00000605 [Cervus elaphus hippelaphus]|uniref:Uncharacterized protein n=1 Tax=Cervus elaphus hippelaphus TaxID=46360 RepID=A0A212D700_CEREH|nr:hypothetical protein Celaphus_00000605 [Cervus elaphus hippelaphus]
MWTIKTLGKTIGTARDALPRVQLPGPACRTFLLSPDAILKPFSKQQSIETALDLINKRNPTCPVLSVLHQMEVAKIMKMAFGMINMTIGPPSRFPQNAATDDDTGTPTCAPFLPLLPLLPSLWIASLCVYCFTRITPDFSGICGSEVLWDTITWTFRPSKSSSRRCRTRPPGGPSGADSYLVQQPVDADALGLHQQVPGGPGECGPLELGAGLPELFLGEGAGPRLHPSAAAAPGPGGERGQAGLLFGGGDERVAQLDWQGPGKDRDAAGGGASGGRDREEPRGRGLEGRGLEGQAWRFGLTEGCGERINTAVMLTLASNLKREDSL